jgi:hypothetical protein
MAKKVKIPQNKKINLDKLESEEEKDFESYTIEIKKIKEENSIPKKTKKTEKKGIQLIKSITSIISVLIFILIIITLTLNILDNLKPNKEEVKEEIKLSTNIIGSWQSATNGLFVFNEDNTFYWYNSHNNLEDNYYKGSYNYKTGLEALTEMGFTEEEFKKEYGAKIKLENVYSINLQPTLVQKNKIDVTTVEVDENKSWWYIMIIKEDYTANGFNKTLDIKYNLIKKSE